MGERSRRAGFAVAIAAVLGLGSGCSATSDTSNTSATPSPPSTWAIPASVGPCDSVTVYPSYNASGYVAAFHWDDNVHAFGETVEVTACVSIAMIAKPEGPPGVTFDPAQQQIPNDNLGVITFTVTVPDGGAGPIRLHLENADGELFSSPPGPVITPSGDGWKFTFPPEPGS